jgi:hypothetical protein
MKKIILLLAFTLLLFSFGIKKVNAKESVTLSYDIKYLANDKSEFDKECNNLLGNPKTKGSVAYYLQMALDIIKYVGIVLCIVLTIIDFAKALFTDDKEMYKPLSKKAFARLIYAVMLFLLPYIVSMVLTLLEVYGTCNIK